MKALILRGNRVVGEIHMVRCIALTWKSRRRRDSQFSESDSVGPGSNKMRSEREKQNHTRDNTGLISLESSEWMDVTLIFNERRQKAPLHLNAFACMACEILVGFIPRISGSKCDEMDGKFDPVSKLIKLYSSIPSLTSGICAY